MIKCSLSIILTLNSTRYRLIGKRAETCGTIRYEWSVTEHLKNLASDSLTARKKRVWLSLLYRAWTSMDKQLSPQTTVNNQTDSTDSQQIKYASKFLRKSIATIIFFPHAVRPGSGSNLQPQLKELQLWPEGTLAINKLDVETISYPTANIAFEHGLCIWSRT